MSNAQALFERAHALMRQSSGGSALSEAATLMKQAADAGHTGAANNFGAMLQHGRGVAEDLNAARLYYRMAADAGLPTGQFNYGFMWLHGLGGERDLVTARGWFVLAAKKNEADALTHLGRMAMIGEGGPQDFKAAHRYWENGALEASDDRCAFNLGIASAGGHGLPPNFVAALAWFKLADALGNSEAQTEMQKISSVMSSDETEAAHERYLHIRANCNAFR